MVLWGILLNNQIVLNKERDKQQEAESLYNFSKYNTRDAYYKDTRMEKSQIHIIK